MRIWIKLSGATATALFLLASIACGMGEAPLPTEPEVEPEPEIQVDAAKYGWLSQVVWDPESFGELMEDSREGWVAYHKNDFEASFKAFPESETVGKSRAAWQLGQLHRDLNRYTGLVNEQYFAAWSLRTKVPEDSSAPVIAALASHCTGSTRLSGWSHKVTKDMAGFEVIERIRIGGEPWKVGGSELVAKRMSAHDHARNGNLASLLANAHEPLIVEQATVIGKDGKPGEPFERKFYDPCISASLEVYWSLTAASLMGGTEWTATVRGWTRPSAAYRATLFAPWLDAEDLDAGQRIANDAGELGALNPSLRRLGVGIDPHHSDDVQSAREEVRSLDAGLDMWREDLLENADDEGRALLEDLGLVSHFRHEWLIVRARYALLENRPHQALAYLELARDVTSNKVGPKNNPLLYALLAETQLMLGHTREALDALEILSVAHPEVTAIKEVTGDLVVLETMDSQGDSKEN